MSLVLLTVRLPRIAVDVKLPANLLLWYVKDRALSFLLRFIRSEVLQVNS